MTAKSGTRALSAAVVSSLLLAAAPVRGDEIRVMISGAFTAAYQEVVPQFEKATANTVVTAFGASMGSTPDSIPNRLQRGEAADVVILVGTALDDLIAQGRVLAGSRVDLARSGIGMAVRAGAQKPDIGSVDALKRTLLQATSIAYSDSASGVYVSTVLFQRLGIASQVAGRSRRIEGDRVAAVVARGEAEIGFQQISELLPVAGAQYVGPLPREVQHITTISAGIAAGAKRAAGGRALVAFLASPSVLPAITKSGLEPVTPGSGAPTMLIRKSAPRAALVRSAGFQTAPADTPTDAAVVAVSYLEVKPASRDQAVAALRRYRESSRSDGGCLRLELFEQIERRGHFAVVETWADQTAFATHGTSAHTTDLLSALEPILVSGYDQRPYKLFTIGPPPARTAGGAIHVITHVDTISGPQGDAPGLLRRQADASRKDEGNLRFDVVRHAVRANHFTIVETWRTQAALDAHAAAPHTQEYRKALQPMSGSPLDERLYRAVE